MLSLFDLWFDMFCCPSGAQVDRWLEPKHREEAHTLEAGVWSIGWLQEKVTTLGQIYNSYVGMCESRDMNACHLDF